MRSCDDDDDELDDDDDEAGSTVFCGPDLYKFIDLEREIERMKVKQKQLDHSDHFDLYTTNFIGKK